MSFPGSDKLSLGVVRSQVLIGSAWYLLCSVIARSARERKYKIARLGKGREEYFFKNTSFRIYHPTSPEFGTPCDG